LYKNVKNNQKIFLEKHKQLPKKILLLAVIMTLGTPKALASEKYLATLCSKNNDICWVTVYALHK